MKIAVGNERFQIQTDLSEEELHALSAYVEAKMEVHLTPGVRVDPKKQLILMAMEITAELFDARRRIQALEQNQEIIGERTIQLVEMLDIVTEGQSANIPSQTAPAASAQAFLE